MSHYSPKKAFFRRFLSVKKSESHEKRSKAFRRARTRFNRVGRSTDSERRIGQMVKRFFSKNVENVEIFWGHRRGRGALVGVFGVIGKLCIVY